MEENNLGKVKFDDELYNEFKNWDNLIKVRALKESGIFLFFK